VCTIIDRWTATLGTGTFALPLCRAAALGFCGPPAVLGRTGTLRILGSVVTELCYRSKVVGAIPPAHSPCLSCSRAVADGLARTAPSRFELRVPAALPCFAALVEVFLVVVAFSVLHCSRLSTRGECDVRDVMGTAGC
jgi:hypothetical protein